MGLGYPARLLFLLPIVNFTISNVQIELCRAEELSPDLFHRIQSGTTTQNDISRMEKSLNTVCEVPNRSTGGVLENGDHWTPLTAALASSRYSLAAFLIGRGTDVNKTTFRGYSPLWIICNSVDGDSPSAVDLCMLLLKSGANTELSPVKQVCPPFDIRPLHVACLRGNLEILKLLSNKGIAVDAVDSSGAGALHYAKIGKRLAANTNIKGQDRSKKVALFDKLITIVQRYQSPNESTADDGP